MPDVNIKFETVEKVIDLVAEPLKKLLGPSVEELGLLFSDGLKLRRMKNVASALAKTEKKCREQGISLKQIDLKVVHPFLVNASLEENDEMQDVWANLMTNYLDSSKNLKSTVYPGVLAQLSSDDVKLLNLLHENKKGSYQNRTNGEYDFSNVKRLGLLKLPPIRYAPSSLEDVTIFNAELSDFGIKFIYACRRD